MTPLARQVLLVDDEEKLLSTIARRMKMLGFTPHTAINGTTAIEIAKKQRIDLAIVDLQMPDMNGLVVITKLKELNPNLKTVLLTGHGNEKVRQATESLNTLYFEKEEMGDFWQFVRKLNADGKVVVIQPASAPPSEEGSALKVSPSNNQHDEDPVQNVRLTRALSDRIASSPANRFEDRIPLRIIGETAAMQELRKSIVRAASLDCAVTLKGEPGSGKELAARAIHIGSRHARKRFLAVDCADFSNAQMTGQLLGFSSGNLCQAIRTCGGIFGVDPVGTLLIDQVEAMPSQIQDQLLKTLTMVESRGAGSLSDAGLDIRIIVATESDLAAKVKAGAFSRDLYDCLTIFEIAIPPLRERKDDIHPLCQYFFDKFRREFGKSIDSISPEVVKILTEYDFPENVRELEYIIERAVIIADGKTVTRRHLPVRFLEDKKPQADSIRFSTLADLEKRYILEVLQAAQGNKSKTAEILGISRAALWRKLKQYQSEQSR